MLSKYKYLTDQERWIEYSRLKVEWVKVNGWNQHEAYDEFIKQIVKDLGI